MLKVSHGGIEAWADAARHHPGGWGNGGDLVLLSMFGPRNAVRSLWATLVGGGKTAGVMIGKDYFSASTGVRYASVQTPMPRRMTHLILVDPACTHQVSSFAGQFIQLGASAHEDFFSRLNRLCPVPFRRSWRLGQSKPVRVIFLAYAGTMQALAMNLIARKMRAAELVDGDENGGLAQFDEAGGNFLLELAQEAMKAREAA